MAGEGEPGGGAWTASVRRLVLPVVLTVLAGWLGLIVMRDPRARDGIKWAIGTWLVPPDADAAWEQQPG